MEISAGTYQTQVEKVLADLERRKVAERIWQKDYTVWKPDPTEIIDRLGWLTCIDPMRKQVPDLTAFSDEVRSDGFRHVVLLGMGGSSLGTEVLAKTLGSARGYPDLIVLDSTVPAQVQAVTDAIEPVHTLFLVSSKSGTTTETLCLMEYFKSLVIPSLGEEKFGKNFVAITDPGTPLAKLAEERGFRRAFLNQSDIGGRYSVLSFFGLVPAALTGANIGLLLERADRLRAQCAQNQPISENPGIQLGAVIGALALQKRDKLTLVTSPAISTFGLWAEQLIAESTGKEGKGIIPIVGEPLLEPAAYGDDRLFVSLRLDGDDNAALDKAISALKSAGQPLVLIKIQGGYDLGAEFFRWEFATAVAGTILGIQPFDQPDVQMAKAATDTLLQHYIKYGKLPDAELVGSLEDLLAKAGAGAYLSILAYLRQNPQLDSVIAGFRSAVVRKFHIATMMGYGPRYLHSTGQLHKGGPDSGLFLEITTGHEKDISIPGKPYTFGVLADAQALGDLQALQCRGRYVARCHLDRGNIATLSRFLAV
ncbi:MAG: glucose-6-phosphate isomerase [Chloroflexi bacterium]|nr:glucose-6-phosphate isomerase [Chloroflexota bacterium]